MFYGISVLGWQILIYVWTGSLVILTLQNQILILTLFPIFVFEMSTTI